MPYKTIEINVSNYRETHTNKLSQFYKGFSTVNPLNFGSKLYDYDLIKQNILNHFNTRKGSRVMNPQFGTIIWDLLMEPLTEETRELLTNDIKTICTFDPRTYPTQIDIREYEQGFLLEITLNLTETNQSTQLRLMFDQKLGLLAE
jgi:phage baseplate assembly protein W